MPLWYNGKNIVLAENLRKNATPQENHLWYDFLSKYDVRFQRQKSIDNFIADFYCHKAKLIIEIDGSQHYTEKGQRNDSFRIELAIGVMVVASALSILILTTALLQNSRRLSVKESTQEKITLSEIGESFCHALITGTETGWECADGYSANIICPIIPFARIFLLFRTSANRWQTILLRLP